MGIGKIIGYSVAAGLAVMAGIHAAKAVKPTANVTPAIPIHLDDVLLVNLSDQRIIHNPTTTMDFGTRPMRVISLSSVQGPDFIMVKKEATSADSSEFIVSIPQSAIIRNMTAGAFAIGF